MREGGRENRASASAAKAAWTQWGAGRGRVVFTQSQSYLGFQGVSDVKRGDFGVEATKEFPVVGREAGEE